MHAAILRVKLRYLPGWLARRQQIAARYNELLAGTPVVTPYVAPDRTHSYYLYTILAPRRDDLRAYLEERGIGTQVIYPLLVPDQGAYRDTPLRCGPIPVARSLVDHILSLPMFPELREDELERVAAEVRAFYD